MTMRYALVCSLAAFTASSAIALDAAHVERWEEDIRHFHQQLLAHHIDLYHSVGRQEFEHELERLIEQLPVLREHQVVLELMRITRLVGDGHTQLPIMASPHTHYPLRFRLFGDEVRVVAAAEAYQSHLGARVVAIGGQPIDEVLQTLRPVVQGVENPFSLQSSLAFHLTIEEMLHAAGITQQAGAAQFSFETDAGDLTSQIVTSVSMHEFVEQTRHRVATRPDFGDRAIEHSDGLWLSTDEATASAYLYFSSYPTFDEMLEFAQRAAEHLDANDIRHLVIDLRDNGGGDFFVGLAMAHPMLMTDSLDWKNGVYALIGRDTFSAAMSNAVQFRQILNARLIGEPTGANPVGYQELGSFELPNSKRLVTYSQRLYRFQQAATQGVQPDVLIATDAATYFAGVDAALDWVMNDIAGRL